jgi:lambda family phage portal protein
VADWRNLQLVKAIAGYLQQKQATTSRVSTGLRTRQYAASRNSRLTADWRTSNSSADAELVSSLTTLRARSRQLIRDASFAKRARVIVVNNVIGTGIGMQAQVMTTRDQLNTRVNDEIESEWADWSEASNCHTGGRLAFKHLERAAMGQVFDAGECIIRKHYRRFGSSNVPYALELIEPERIADELASPSIVASSTNHIRMGVEVDEFYRPVAYYIRRRHPGEIRWTGARIDEIERVPADQIIHLAVIDRWPQTRGEPWLHAAARRLNDMEGYSEAEIVKARAQASTSGWIKTPEDGESFGELQADGSYQEETEPGVWKRLNPGEEPVMPPSTAPNSVYEAFMRAMLREVAAGIGVSFESLSRDYSQSNYSSSRLALLDDRDMWRFYQSWFITDFRNIIHKEWLAAAILSGTVKSILPVQYALDPRKFQAVRYKPRGWTWVDPTKEVEAFKEAIKAGLTTQSDVIAATSGGRDIEDIFDERALEIKMAKEKGLVFDTSPEIYTADAAAKKSADPPPDDQPEKTTQETDQPENPAKSRVFSFGSKR